MKTEILVITDRSGSMGSIRSAVIEGFNSFITDQKTVPGEAKVTYIQFDSQYEVVYAGTPVQDVPLLTAETFVPRGSTAMQDAIGKTLNEQGKRIHDEAWADLVIVYVITDGEENASSEFTLDQVKEMVKHTEANGWKFIFQAANIDAVNTAMTYGVSAKLASTLSSNFDASAVGTTMAYATNSNLTRALRTSNV